MNREEVLKESLLQVFEIDLIINRFHNKVQFMNLNHYMQRAGSWDAEKLSIILTNLQEVRRQLDAVDEAVRNLAEPTQSLIESYAWERNTEGQ